MPSPQTHTDIFNYGGHLEITEENTRQGTNLFLQDHGGSRIELALLETPLGGAAGATRLYPGQHDGGGAPARLPLPPAPAHNNTAFTSGD